MTRVWRVENYQGSSPFVEPYFANKPPTGLQVDRRDDFAHVKESLPWRRVRFGMTTRENLIEWFGFSLVKEFYKEGYRIVTYIVDDRYVMHSKSRYQLMFDLDHARLDYEVEENQLMSVWP